MSHVRRLLPDDESRDLLALTEDIAAKELQPLAAAGEESSVFPRDTFRLLGRAGLLSLPYPQQYGGGGQPYEVYLQVVEELARAWLAVGMGVSVHVLSCFPVATAGDEQQKLRWLPDMLEGHLLGAYCLSEPDSGSDAAALSTTAVAAEGHYTLNGTKAWITHAGHADFYNVMARTGGAGASGISCLLVPADSDGLSFGAPEDKMGVRSSATAQVLLSGVQVDRDRLIGEPGEGFRIAMAALDSGRLGIAACAVGVAQAALDLAVDYAGTRQQFGHPIGSFQGIGFMLADMAAGVAAARALYVAAARRKDAAQPFAAEAAMAKLVATDTAMKVTTDAVQILGGAGYTSDFPAERYFREAKLLQIVEGTNQIQRMVISRGMLR